MNNFTKILFSVLLLSTLSAAAPVVSNITLGNETLSNVVNHTPIIFWSYQNGAGPQAFYQVEVIAITTPVSVRWNSGMVASSDTSALYAGLTLFDNIDYTVRIRVN